MEGNKEFITKIKDLSGNELKDAVREEKRKQVIDLVCRQTDYTREKAEEARHYQPHGNKRGFWRYF